MGANKQFKASVIADYLTEEKTNNSRLRELSQACGIIPEGANPKIEVNTLQNVLYMDRVNDISFTVDGKLVILVEHQSTLNRNMPLRMLIYMGRLYEKILNLDSIYKTEMIRIPTPEFIVLYNGTDACPDEWEQKLSEAYIEQGRELGLELKVKVWNINFNENSELLQKCRSLWEYSFFVKTVRDFKATGLPLEEAIREAINVCISEDVMKSYLENNGSEVLNVLTQEWNMDEALRVSRAEGEETGEKRGIKIGVMKALCALVSDHLLGIDEAVKRADMPRSEFLGWMHQFNPEYKA